MCNDDTGKVCYRRLPYYLPTEGDGSLFRQRRYVGRYIGMFVNNFLAAIEDLSGGTV